MQNELHQRKCALSHGPVKAIIPRAVLAEHVTTIFNEHFQDVQPPLKIPDLGPIDFDHGRGLEHRGVNAIDEVQKTATSMVVGVLGPGR